MAGVKGRSGGARPGAGRKPAPAVIADAEELQTDDPIEFLRAYMRDPNNPLKDRKEVAITLAKLKAPPGRQGKGEQRKQAAEDVVDSGRFAPVDPPRLRAVK